MHNEVIFNTLEVKVHGDWCEIRYNISAYEMKFSQYNLDVFFTSLNRSRDIFSTPTGARQTNGLRRTTPRTNSQLHMRDSY